MKLLEYQAKQILRKKGLPVPRGEVIRRPSDIDGVLEELGIERGVLKAQVLAGGRGKAGGIKVFENREQARQLAKEMLGMTLVTHQTGPEGLIVNELLLEECVEVKKEFYIAMMVDRASQRPVMILNREGGGDIEEVAAVRPESIMTLGCCVRDLMEENVKLRAAHHLGVQDEIGLAIILDGLNRVFVERDCNLLEINPLAETVEGKLLLLDCKFSVDPNALFRQKYAGVDPDQEKDEAEKRAGKFGMSYIQLDGDIGCMVNGAGLAMATMDIILSSGHRPANFLDVGGSASEDAVAEAFRIIQGDKGVHCMFINIFGGIMKCDVIARGIVKAAAETGLKIPLVVRLEGTNRDEGQKILASSGLDITPATDMADGAAKAAAAAAAFAAKGGN